MSGSDATHPIASHPLPRGEELRIELRQYRGGWKVDVRIWYPGPDGALLPGKGLSAPLHTLPWLTDAMRRAEDEALQRGLLDEEAFESIGRPLPAALGGA